MATMHKTFFELTAEDLMSRDIIAIPSSMPLRAAAHRLIAAAVSGAPVIDETGQCLGVLSQTDLVRFLDQSAVPQPPRLPSQADVFADWQMLDLENLPADEVTRYMTPGAITASMFAPIQELAGLMSDSHIHRVLITGENGRVIGIVSALDILEAVASSADDRMTG